jgi:serine/threonine protein kinase
VFEDNIPPQSTDSSSSSADDPIELDRIREWMDHHDWDSLDEPSEVRRDKEICIQLLLKNSVRIASDFELSEASSGSQESSHNTTHFSEESNLSGHRIPTEPPQQVESKPRFSAPLFLGVGAFGIVFSVRDELLGMDVAIKILRPSKSRSQELRARFIGEAQVTASLCHPSIVRVYDTGQIGGLPYITSSKLDGGTLADYLAKGKPLSIRQAAWMVARISDSVQFAHSKAILHRDLKPSNVLLKPCELDRSEQFGFEPMLTDFGLAKRLDKQDSSTNKTRDGRVLGTARYMSPEQARGAHSEVGTASDVFSLGILLYQLLLGKVPFDDPLDQNIRTMISEKEPRRPRLVDKSISADLEAVVLKCLAKEPAARYQSASQLSLELDRFLRGEPVEAKKSTFFRRWGYAVRKYPVVSSLLAIAFFTNCMALVSLSISLRNERISKERERQRAIDLVLVYTKVGDDIFAGKRIKDSVMLDLSLKMRGVLVEFLNENPDDERILHLKSVLSHFQSIAYQRVGTREQYIAARVEVLEILAKLLQAHPENELYQFQQFFSRLILGDWLVSTPELRPASISLSGIELLENAHSDIERLSQKNPTKIEYLDALAATKLNIAILLYSSDPDKCKQLTTEAISISEKLWLDHPDRPVLAKHAIRGYARIASYLLLESEKELALAACESGMQLFNSAWRPIEDEAWVMQDISPVLVIWIEVLVANGKLEQALSLLDDSDRYLAFRLADFPNDIDLQLAILNTGVTRHEVLLLMGNMVAAQTEWERLIQIGKELKSQKTFWDALTIRLDFEKRSNAIRAIFDN